MSQIHKKIAFWGTPDLTIEYLDALQTAGMTPVVIVTNPDRPKGRGHELASPAPKIWAEKNNIPVLQPEKLDDAFFSTLSSYDLDISIIVAYGKIISQRCIDIPKHGSVNVHYSKLPYLRGASPVESAILAGDTETGTSIQQMAFKLDSGAIITEETMAIDPNETAPALRMRLTKSAAQLLVATLPKYLAGEITLKVQDESLATHCGKIQKELGEIDPTGDSTINYRKYRAYFEWPRTYFFVQNGDKKTRVIITQASFQNGDFIIEKVLPEGKKEIAYSDFLRNQK